MDISPINKLLAPVVGNKVKSTPEAPTEGRGKHSDRVELSPEAKQAAAMRQEAASQPGADYTLVRPEVVSAARQRVSDGFYLTSEAAQVTAHELASALNPQQ